MSLRVGWVVSLLLWVVVLLGAGCKQPKLQLGVSYKASVDGVKLTVETNRPVEDLYIPALHRSIMGFIGKQTFDVPWSGIEDQGDGSGLILVTARVKEGSEARRVAIPKFEVKGALKPNPSAAAKPTATASAPNAPDEVNAIAQPSEEKPVVMLAPPRSTTGETAKLTGGFGEYADVVVDPLRLTFAALPDATLEHNGKPLPFDQGKATLEIAHADLLLDTPPGDLASLAHKPWYKLALQQKYKGESKAMVIYLERPKALNDLIGALLPVMEGTPLPFLGGARKGGALVMPGQYSQRVLVINAPDTTRALAAVGLVSDGAASKSPSKTCRYSGGYSQSYYRADKKLVVFSAATGKKLGERSVSGTVPRSCPFTIMTYGSSKSGTMTVQPGDAELSAAFKQIAKLK